MLPRTRRLSRWTEQWQSIEDRLQQLQARVRSEGATALAGGPYDDWDLEVQGGMCAGVRTRMAIEEHGAGRQMVRFKAWPRCSRVVLLFTFVIACLAASAAYSHSWGAATLLGGISLLAAWRMLHECSLAMQKLTYAVHTAEDHESIRQAPAVVHASAQVEAL
jgi:hypothetical protein